MEAELEALPEEEDAAAGGNLPGASGESLEGEESMDESALQSALELASMVVCYSIQVEPTFAFMMVLC